jgi:hypothetical protein
VESVGRPLGGVCSKGHNDWLPNGAGKRKCAECERVKAANRIPVDFEDKCRNGHLNWIIRSDGKRRCITCQKAANAEEWQRRKARMKLAKEAG